MLVVIPLPPVWKELWEAWDLRGFIILSLSLKTFLILFAPIRKRKITKWIIMPLWSAYLLADWAAKFVVGMGNTNDVSVKKGDTIPKENVALLAFWVPFLLVHLGGPDTITAFALKDNELWLGHLLGLVVQRVAAFIESDIIKLDEDKRKIAKSLSDYMLYLLIMKPSMIPVVASVGQIRFRDTCAEAKRFFEDGKGGKQSKIRDITEGQRNHGLDLKHINACKDILNVSTEVPPVILKGDRSTSLLIDG
nr:uncharacterized protein [Tanacetum cinerariifolium]